MAGTPDRVAVTLAEWPDDVDSDEGVVVNWFVREGGHVDADGSLCEVQIEKVSLDVYAPISGTLTEVVVGEDGEFADGDTLGWMVPDDG
jgi:pyruvate/2-oxoglutarate dehydrogenase complex dihydrolipoamide acyltransferase (E2) component